ncbi:cell division ATP-binding protein FtsE [candidate division WOR-3 bacterium]|nr:cell division ATP-binding protein FtsE [candidate division WOR-3 bacterium]
MIEFNQVTKTYRKDWKALDDLTFTIDQGSYTFIVGPSGSGKSTVLKLIYGAISPNKGYVQVSGFRIPGIPKNQLHLLRRKVGVIFQDFRLMEDRTIYENIAFVLLVTGTPRKTIKDKISTVLASLRLTHKIHQYPYQLSGGEQQKVSIARALVREPFVLVADEPTGNVDPEGSAEIFQILKDINSSGTTVIMATHELDYVKNTPFRVISLTQGKIVSDTKEKRCIQ